MSKTSLDSIRKVIMDKEPKKKEVVYSTGCDLLDLTVGGGERMGFPGGWIINLVGDSGAGKTLAAIETINRMVWGNDKLITVIVCPFLALLEQWEDELKGRTNFQFLPACYSKDKWYDSLKSEASQSKIYYQISGYETSKHASTAKIKIPQTLTFKQVMRLLFFYYSFLSD